MYLMLTHDLWTRVSTKAPKLLQFNYSLAPLGTCHLSLSLIGVSMGGCLHFSARWSMSYLFDNMCIDMQSLKGSKVWL